MFPLENLTRGRTSVPERKLGCSVSLPQRTDPSSPVPSSNSFHPSPALELPACSRTAAFLFGCHLGGGCWLSAAPRLPGRGRHWRGAGSDASPPSPGDLSVPPSPKHAQGCRRFQKDLRLPRAAAISQPDQVLPPNTDELGPPGLCLLLRELLSANCKLTYCYQLWHFKQIKSQCCALSKRLWNE